MKHELPLPQDTKAMSRLELQKIAASCRTIGAASQPLIQEVATSSVDAQVYRAAEFLNYNQAVLNQLNPQ